MSEEDSLFGETMHKIQKSSIAPYIIGALIGTGTTTGVQTQIDPLGLAGLREQVATCESNRAWLLDRNTRLVKALGVDLGD